MGQNVSTLRDIGSAIEAICAALRPLVSSDLVRQGLAIDAKIKEFIAAIPWFYSAAFIVAVFIYFLPQILNMMADWLRALRAAWENLKSAWGDDPKPGSRDDSKPGAPGSAKADQLEKRINKLEAENEKLRKLLEENQKYATENNVKPIDIFDQNTETLETRKEARKQTTSTEEVLYN